MARKKRICLPETTYHVYSRCANREDRLADDLFKDLLLDIIDCAHRLYDFELVFYQIMDTHFHFVIRTVTDGADISTIMQYIKGRFAYRYNRLTGRSGPFWNERFSDIIVEQQDNPARYLLWLLWYLAYNSVKAGLVTDPRRFEHGSINSYLDEGRLSPVKITLHAYFLELGTSFKERVARFLEYEVAYRKRLAVYF